MQKHQHAKLSIAPMMVWTDSHVVNFENNTLALWTAIESYKIHTNWSTYRAIFSRFCIWIASLLAVLSMSVVNAARAEEARMDSLASSYLIENLVAERNWEVTLYERRIDYVCLVCGGKLIARLEVLAPYDAGHFSTPGKRYLAERRQRCFELTANGQGRCVGTQHASVRRSLSGFQSETEMLSKREIEIVFFYHDRRWPGPELIRTTIDVSEGATLPEESVVLFMWHMARLTLFW